MLFPQKINALRRLYHRHGEPETALPLSILFSIGLCITRVLYTGESLFLFLIWNLFLAYVPYAVSGYLMRHVHWIEENRRLIPALAVWLLFLPNSFYILTDLFHLARREAVPLWFDLALIFSFAWNGLLLGVRSVQQVEQVVKVKWNLRMEWLFVVPLMALNALGIYIGRYLRYNSWDVVRDPLGLTEDLAFLLLHPVRHRFDWSMVLCYTVFMTLVYSTMKRPARS